MQILKLLGVALILSAGGFAAVCAIRYEKRRIAVLDGWIDLILYIRTQIDCYLMPIGEILAVADPSLLRSVLCNSPRPDLTALYHTSQFYLDNESKRLVCTLIRELGTSYREEQLRRCDYYTSVLRRIRDKRQEELPARVRVTVALCLTAAAAAAILLW